MITTEELDRCSRSLQKEIDSVNPDICGNFPITGYMKDVKYHLQLRTHSYYNRRRRGIFGIINKQYGAAALSLYHKLALVHLMLNSLKLLNEKPFPNAVRRNILAWYKRIVDDFSRQPETYFHHRNTDFIYDLGVCCLKSLPVGGAWFVQIRRIGFRFIASANVSQLIAKLWYVLFTMRGFSRYCVIHTYARYLPKFNADQLNQAYVHIGELMKCDAKIRGIYRRSWFLDPELESISPNLSYIRDIPLKNGARFFEAGSTEHDVRDAVKFSPVRQKLYKEGKYSPKAYAYIWPRERFLRWLDQLGTDWKKKENI